MLLFGGVTYNETSNETSGIIAQEADIQNSNKLLTGALVVTDEPDNNIAVYFDTITEHSVSVQNQITDNWLENNSAVQDAIAHSPITVTLSGVSGELVYVPSTNDKRFLRSIYNAINAKIKGEPYVDEYRDYVVTDKLTVIPELLPPVDNVTQMAKNLVTQVEDNIARYEKIVKSFVRNTKDESRLQEIYRKLMYLRDNNISLVVETPFGIFESMYIQSASFTQGNENYSANISMTLKQLNFTDQVTTNVDTARLAEINASMRAQVEDHGVVRGKNVSLTKDFLNKLNITKEGSGIRK